MLRISKMKTVAVIVGIAALTFSGVALASSRSATAPPKASDQAATAVDTDNVDVQQGNQNAADDATEVAGEADAGAADTDNVDVQEGPQTGADTKAAAAGSENAGPESDGPGGHADAGSEASVDHQFNGNE